MKNLKVAAISILLAGITVQAQAGKIPKNFHFSDKIIAFSRPLALLRELFCQPVSVIPELAPFYRSFSHRSS